MTNTDRLPILALISGGGSNLQSLIDAVEEGRINAVISAVISNRPSAYGLQRAQIHGIASDVIDHRHYSGRHEFEKALRDRIETYSPALVLMAGFMRVLTEEFVACYEGRLLNIHPSLLPDFRGLHTHNRAIDAGVQVHGCSVHFATSDLDSGPVILQASVSVLPIDDAESLAARVLEKEHIIYPLAVKWFCEGRLRLHQNAAELDGKSLAEPLQLESLNKELL